MYKITSIPPRAVEAYFFSQKVLPYLERNEKEEVILGKPYLNYSYIEYTSTTYAGGHFQSRARCLVKLGTLSFYKLGISFETIQSSIYRDYR